MPRALVMLAILGSLTSATACGTPSGADGGSEGSTDSDAESSSGTQDETGEVEAVCGDGVVSGDEQCDAGAGGGDDTCNARCLVPGAMAWTLAVDDYVTDMDVGADRVLLCGSSGVTALELAEGASAQPSLVAPLEGCERVATNPSGAFAVLRWVDRPSGGGDDAMLTAHDADGAVRWEGSQRYEWKVFSRPDVAVGPTGNIAVAGTLADAEGFQVVELDADGGEIWAYVETGHAESNAVAIDSSGTVLVSGAKHPPDYGGRSLVLVLDGGSALYSGGEDFEFDGIDAAVSVARSGSSIIVGVRRNESAQLSGFVPPARGAQWSRDLSSVLGEAVSVVSHPSGAVVVAYVTQDEHRLELVDAQGEASWTTSWPRGADDDGLAALAVDDTGDIYVAALGGSASVWAFVSPQ